MEEYFRPQLELLLSIIGELVPDDTPSHVQRQVAFSIIGQCLFYRIAGEVVEMMAAEDDRNYFAIGQLAEHITRFSLAAISEPSQLGERDKTVDRPTTVA